MASVELGDSKVQGLDYADPLQGWLKGINSNSFNVAHDMEQDGNTVANNPNRYFAKM